jgi:hypothetical protein
MFVGTFYRYGTSAQMMWPPKAQGTNFGGSSSLLIEVNVATVVVVVPMVIA